MRIAYLDCFSGMSGDMFLGALVDAGVPAKLLHDTVAALDPGARLEISRVNRSGITATKVDVYVDGEKDLPREEYWEQRAMAQPPSAAASITHRHKHGHDGVNTLSMVLYGRAHRCYMSMGTNSTFQPTHHGRGLNRDSGDYLVRAISGEAKKTAIAIFEALGAAEAKIHNTDIEKVHFHEVGAVDAMVDIVCAAVGAEALGVDEIICSSAERGRRNGQVRARNVSGARARDRGIAERCARVFVRLAGGTGHAYRCGDCEGAGAALCGISGDEDREVRLWRGVARLSWTSECGATDYRRNPGARCRRKDGIGDDHGAGSEPR